MDSDLPEHGPTGALDVWSLHLALDHFERTARETSPADHLPSVLRRIENARDDLWAILATGTTDITLDIDSYDAWDLPFHETITSIMMARARCEGDRILRDLDESEGRTPAPDVPLGPTSKPREDPPERELSREEAFRDSIVAKKRDGRLVTIKFVGSAVSIESPRRYGVFRRPPFLRLEIEATHDDRSVGGAWFVPDPNRERSYVIPDGHGMIGVDISYTGSGIAEHIVVLAKEYLADLNQEIVPSYEFTTQGLRFYEALVRKGVLRVPEDCRDRMRSIHERDGYTIQQGF